MCLTFPIFVLIMFKLSRGAAHDLRDPQVSGVFLFGCGEKCLGKIAERKRAIIDSLCRAISPEKSKNAMKLKTTIKIAGLTPQSHPYLALFGRQKISRRKITDV